LDVKFSRFTTRKALLGEMVIKSILSHWTTAEESLTKVSSCSRVPMPHNYSNEELGKCHRVTNKIPNRQLDTRIRFPVTRLLISRFTIHKDLLSGKGMT